MYVSYINDRKELGYEVVKDTNYGIELVSTTESTVLLIRNLSFNLKGKSKRIVVVISLATVVLFSNLESVSAIGLQMPATPVVRVYPSYKRQYQIEIAPTVNPRLDKIYFMPNKEMIPLIYLNGHHCYINEYLLKKLRASDLYGTLTVVTIGIVVYIIYRLSDVDAFVIIQELGKLNAPMVYPESGLSLTYSQPSSRTVPGSALEITRPTAMPHQEFVGLTKAERRQVPHPYDKIINVKGHPQLRVGFWQSRYKVPDHGVFHSLPYKNNGGTRTEKSDHNALAMMQSIEDMAHRPNTMWFDQDDVTYPGGTDRELPAVHIFDDDTKIIVVFNKQTGNFITTCKLVEKEETELKATHNFGGSVV